MADQADTIVEGEGTFVYDNPEAEWAAVLAVAPAMNRLPDMVADTYQGYGLPEEVSLEELKGAVRSRVRTGSIFIFKLIKNNVNKLFENYSLHFGQGIDLLMDDLDAVMSTDMETVENYTPAEVCGRLFAYMAMDIYSRQRDEEEPDGNIDMIDDTTGFYKDMEVVGCLHHLQGVLSSVRMTLDFANEARDWATNCIHAQIFMLAEKTDKTVLH